MELTGRIKSITKDWKSSKINITFELDESPTEELENLAGFDKLLLTIKKFRQRRSLNSNAYCWVLITKIAEAIHSDKWDVYLNCLIKYSNDFTFVVCKESAVDKMKELYRTCVDLGEITVNGNKGHQLQVYFGSSGFDSKQMSVFLEGIVAECKELGIETLTPREIEVMNQKWNQ